MSESSRTTLLVERLPSKIHTTDPFEVVPEPNIVAHITEQNSHFPWQQKTERKGEEENTHLKPFRPFNIHDRGDCGGSRKVWNIKPPKKHWGGCHHCYARTWGPPYASSGRKERKRRGEERRRKERKAEERKRWVPPVWRQAVSPAGQLNRRLWGREQSGDLSPRAEECMEALTITHSWKRELQESAAKLAGPRLPWSCSLGCENESVYYMKS